MSFSIRYDAPSASHHYHHHRSRAGRRPAVSHLNMRSGCRMHHHRPPQTNISIKTPSAAATCLAVGVAALIAALACIIFGAIILNPPALAVGIGLGIAGVVCIATGGAFLGSKLKK